MFKLMKLSNDDLEFHIISQKSNRGEEVVDKWCLDNSVLSQNPGPCYKNNYR
jgi:hypothetical protein